jgi:undecaprenyl-diphosphatase
MNSLQAIAYGLVQGLGEFLPISSSAHLVVLPWVARWNDPGLAFDVALHLGTLLSLLIYFRRELWRLSLALFGVGTPGERRLAQLVVVGSIPGAAIGFLLEHAAEELFRESMLLIAGTMALMGILLWAVDAAVQTARPLDQLSFRDAILVGLAQACAIVPGVSRSGSTITVGRLVGLDREASARFSFLLAAPIVAGAGLLKVPKLVKEGGMNAATLIGMGVAAVAGYLAIAALLRLVKTRSYLPFALYRLAFGAGLAALWYARAH